MNTRPMLSIVRGLAAVGGFFRRRPYLTLWLFSTPRTSAKE